jgi:anti-anti-sigma regulatory factor
MLRVTTEGGKQPLTMKVEGKLCGPWVPELEKEWSRAASEAENQEVIADLSNLTFLDSAGWDLLERMAQQGVDLQAHELLPRFVIGEIQSHLDRKAHEEVGDEEAIRVGNR